MDKKLHRFIFTFFILTGFLGWASLSQALEAVKKVKGGKAIPVDFPPSLGEVEKWTLKNGLKVILHPESHRPRVYYQTLFAVGSGDEKEGERGMAHLLKGLLFKGSRNKSGSAFRSETEKRGIDMHASISYDYSSYAYHLPPQHLKWVIKTEADRMAWPLLRKRDLQTEKSLLLQERTLQWESSPWGSLHPQSMKLLFNKDPYGHPILGNVEDIKNYTRKQVKDFYAKHYVPNNAVLVLSGNFHSSQVKKWIQKYYKNIRSPSVPKEKFLSVLSNAPPQTQARKQNLYKNIKAIYLSVLFKGVPEEAPDSQTLEVLSFILGENTASRLYRRLVYFNRVALSIDSHYHAHRRGGFFLIKLPVYPHIKPARALYLIKDELRKLRTKPVYYPEIRKARNHLMKNLMVRFSILKERSHLLAYHELFSGNHQKAFHLLNDYNRVTSQKILKAANKYLKPRQMNITILSPLQAKREK